MLTEELKRYKKIGGIVGKNLALDKLEAYIGECPDRRIEIMKLAWLLGSDECHQKRVGLIWQISFLTNSDRKY
ncbi:hypothetical protein UZS95_17670 [Parabacteroides goldsteinii]|uniref:hypothetical protein n=1 Tax=Parabacteroides goldsteinii TaxID=328812 RepID=UPI002ABAE3E9|nr:hypothetical protein [Parabacteroides goldsteinii]MDZ3928249.1 hypothetical protein [Parabacteroides goldsteinii]